MLGLFGRRALELPAIERQAHAWIRRLASGRATQADVEALAQWCRQSPDHAAALRQAQQLWRTAGDAGQLIRDHAPLAAQRRAGRLANPSRRIWLGAAVSTGIASAVVAAYPPLGLWPSFDEWGADYATGTGEQRKIALDDRVHIALNTQTRVAVRTASGSARSIELLRGQAAIDLQTDQLFTVISDRGEAQSSTSGTNFEVRRSGSETCVTCIAGTVHVQLGSDSLDLHENQQVFYGNGHLGRPTTVDARTASAWRDGLLVFHRTALRDVVAEINRYRPGRVVLLNDDKASLLLNGRFRIDALDDALHQIQNAFGVRARSVGTLLVLT